eukprot:763100-Hanusia_phi.AAC.8
MSSAPPYPRVELFRNVSASLQLRPRAAPAPVESTHLLFAAANTDMDRKECISATCIRADIYIYERPLSLSVEHHERCGNAEQQETDGNTGDWHQVLDEHFQPPGVVRFSGRPSEVLHGLQNDLGQYARHNLTQRQQDHYRQWKENHDGGKHIVLPSPLKDKVQHPLKDRGYHQQNRALV